MTNLRARLAEVLARLDAMPLLLAKDAAALLRQQADALARALEDAERYRWLRDISESQLDNMPIVADGTPNDVPCLVAAKLDAAIDAARNRHD